MQTELHYSQTRGMHTSSAEYTTFITFELINRMSGAKPLASLSLENEGEKNKRRKQAIATMNKVVQEKEKIG